MYQCRPFSRNSWWTPSRLVPFVNSLQGFALALRVQMPWTFVCFPGESGMYFVEDNAADAFEHPVSNIFLNVFIEFALLWELRIFLWSSVIVKRFICINIKFNVTFFSGKLLNFKCDISVANEYLKCSFGRYFNNMVGME